MADVGGHEWIGRVDYLDDAISLIVEIQSQTYHSSFLDQRADDVRVAELLGAGFKAVLLVPEEAVWYRSDRVLKAVRLARQALTSDDPERFVIGIRSLGVRFEMTKAEGRRGERAG